MARKNGTRKKKSSALAAEGMPVVHPNTAGIDIGSREHWVCAAASDGSRPIKRFGTTTPQLEALADWLQELGVTSVAMESTYVYWIPVYELLESRGVEVLLANAREVKNVPGRSKSDVSDCAWLQKLHTHGLIRASFRPPKNICAMRTLQRHAASLIEQRTRHTQLMQRSLDQMNIQIHRAVTDLTGKTGLAIVRAILDGQRDPRELAKLRDRRCKVTEEELAEHLQGTWIEEHLFTLASGLRMLEDTERELEFVESRVMKMIEELQPEEAKTQVPPKNPDPRKERSIKQKGGAELRTALWRFIGCDLSRIDGISPSTAMIVLTEVGYDLSAFPTEKHFVSWLRLCPRQAVSGGKRLKRPRNSLAVNRITTVLRMAALSIQRTETALGAHFRKIARARNGNVAIFAIARKLALLIYRMLKYGQDYVDEGAQVYEERLKHRRIHSLQQNAKSLGYKLIPIAEAG
jgi:transposase